MKLTTSQVAQAIKDGCNKTALFELLLQQYPGSMAVSIYTEALLKISREN
jgi:hypothetical protein